VFRGLDVVIAEAQRAGLRVILSFVDNWKYFGGVDEVSVDGWMRLG
jgi:endo-1,4-beta-mannosidase